MATPNLTRHELWTCGYQDARRGSGPLMLHWVYYHGYMAGERDLVEDVWWCGMWTRHHEHTHYPTTAAFTAKCNGERP